MYAVVEFKNKECALIPLLWLDGQKCSWPKVKNEEIFLDMVKKCHIPNLNWPTYQVEKTLYTGENFDTALKHFENILEEVSSEVNASSASLTKKLLVESHSLNSSSDFDDTERPQKKRKRNNKGEPPKKLQQRIENSSSSDSEIVVPKSVMPSTEQNINDELISASWSSSQSEFGKPSEVDAHSSPYSTPPSRSDTPNSHVQLQGIPRTPNVSLVTNIRHNILNERLITTLEQLKATQDQHSIILDEILRSIKYQGNIVQRPDDLPNLPINTKQDYKTLEQSLMDESKYSFLRSRLVAVGGTTVRVMTMNMLKYLMTNRIAMKFNWAGRDKKPFKTTQMMKLIYEAVKLAFAGRGDSVRELNDVEIANAVKDWLKLSKQRYQYSESKLHSN